MDPNAALDELATAIYETDVIRAREILEDLSAWVARGGFVDHVRYHALWSQAEHLIIEVEELFASELEGEM
jgi:hypothetical protein